MADDAAVGRRLLENERLQTADDLQRHPLDNGHDRRLREFSEVPDRGTKPNPKKITEYVERSLMLVATLSPVIGYDKASKIAHYAMDNVLTLKAAALKLGFVTEAEFNRVVDPAKMIRPYVAQVS